MSNFERSEGRGPYQGKRHGIVGRDVVCNVPTKLDPPGRPQKISFVYTKDLTMERVDMKCKRIKEGQGNCGRDGPVCEVVTSLMSRGKQITGEAAEPPVIVHETAMGKVIFNEQTGELKVGENEAHLSPTVAVTLGVLLDNPNIDIPYKIIYSATDYPNPLTTTAQHAIDSRIAVIRAAFNQSASKEGDTRRGKDVIKKKWGGGAFRIITSRKKPPAQ